MASAFVSGMTADYFRSRGILTTIQTRRIYQCVSFLGMATCLIITGFASCETRTMAVVFLSLAVMFAGPCAAVFNCNHIDFAPKYGGILFGITNTVATIPGMIAPIVAGALTPNKSAEEWRSVFYICAAIDVFGALVLGFCVKAEIEPWAKDKTDDKPCDEKSSIKLIEKNGLNTEIDSL